MDGKLKLHGGWFINSTFTAYVWELMLSQRRRILRRWCFFYFFKTFNEQIATCNSKFIVLWLFSGNVAKYSWWLYTSKYYWRVQLLTSIAHLGKPIQLIDVYFRTHAYRFKIHLLCNKVSWHITIVLSEQRHNFFTTKPCVCFSC